MSIDIRKTLVAGFLEKSLLRYINLPLYDQTGHSMVFQNTLELRGYLESAEWKSREDIVKPDRVIVTYSHWLYNHGPVVPLTYSDVPRDHPVTIVRQDSRWIPMVSGLDNAKSSVNFVSVINKEDGRVETSGVTLPVVSRRRSKQLSESVYQGLVITVEKALELGFRMALRDTVFETFPTGLIEIPFHRLTQYAVRKILKLGFTHIRVYREYEPDSTRRRNLIYQNGVCVAEGPWVDSMTTPHHQYQQWLNFTLVNHGQ